MTVFRQVVECGTIVAAGERLNLSTAMTSKHVMHIEKRLGIRLLNRSSRSLSLTEAGKLFFERCKVVLDEMQDAELAVSALSGPPRGTLRVTCPTWGATRRMGDLLAAYRKGFPEVTVEMSFDDRFIDLVKEGYDVALRCTTGSPPSGLIARPLRSVPFLIAASGEYLKRSGLPKTPEELRQHDGVMVGHADFWELSGPNGKVKVQPRVVLRMGSIGGAGHAASAGIGLTALPLTVIEDPGFRGTLHPILSNYPLQQPQFYAIYASRKNVPPKIRSFIDHLIDHMAKVPLPRISTTQYASF